MFINTVQFLSIASNQSLNNALQVSRHMMNQRNQTIKSHNTNLNIHEIQTPPACVEVKKKQEVIDVCTPLGIERLENISTQTSFNSNENSSQNEGDKVTQVTINVLEDISAVIKKCKELRNTPNASNNNSKNQI